MQTRNFLGTSGAATVVLLNSPDPETLPKMEEARRLFQVDEIKYYKGEGWYAEEIEQLERALEIIKGKEPTPPWQKVSTTNVLLLPPGTSPSDFFLLKYASILVHGFNLTDACMLNLAGHVKNHSQVLQWRYTVEDFYQSLRHHSEFAKHHCIQDQSILDPDIRGLEQVMNGYGDCALAEATQDISLWYSFHKW
jgi:hypothetical protein